MDFRLIGACEAHALQNDDPNTVLVDVRSQMEFLMIGHPVGAINVPWIDEPHWERNPHFVAETRRLLLGRATAKGVSLILICRSDNRSRDAAQALVEAGLSNIAVVEHGFEGPLNAHRHRSSVGGWRKEGLPWEQA